MNANLIDVLKKERNIALGCTEPGAVAYAAAYAAEQLGKSVQELELIVSGNIMKNALSVGIPRTNLCGIKIAAALGCLSGNAEKKLEGLNGITQEDIEEAERFIQENRVRIKLAKDVDKLYIRAICRNAGDSAEVEIQKDHTNITLVMHNGVCIYRKECDKTDSKREEEALTMESIYEFVCAVPEEALEFLKETVQVNKKVYQEGMEHPYGLNIGKKLKQQAGELRKENLDRHVTAMVIAAVDARMGGCPLPVAALNGSGNQGITSSLPVVFYGEYYKKSEEEIRRALALSQLITIYIKQKTGKLSALCGSALAAATGASCGITYLLGGGLPEIGAAVKNMVADLSGMVCDGAKAGCSLKIATALNSAMRSAAFALEGISASCMDGIVDEGIDQTIDNLGTLGVEGMEITDETILKIMAKQ